jgi:exosortase
MSDMATLQTDLSETSPRPGRAPVPWRVWAVALCLAAALLPLLAAHARQLWLRPHYQFAPLLLVGAAVLAWLGLRRPVPLAPGSAWLRRLLAALGWAALTAAVLLNSSWLGAASAMVLLAAVVYAIGGGALCRRLFPAWLFLWLAVPPPFEYDRALILGLQTLTARWSSAMLDALGVFHVMAGHVVEVGGQRLLVEQACGGINSLLAVLACTLFFVLFARRPPVRAVLLVAAAAAWVLAANVARVVGVAYLYTRWGLDLASGWRHDAFGLALFVLALGLIWSTDRLLAFLLAPSAPKPNPVAAPARGGGEGVPGGAAGGLEKTWLASWPAGLAFAALAAAHLALNGVGVRGPAAPAGPEIAGLDALDQEAAPPSADGYRLLAFAQRSRNPGSEFGEFSREWSYQLGLNAAALSLDYPFPGWHDLTRCYTTQGWTIDRETVVPEGGEDGGAPPGSVELQLSKPGYRSAYLLFCQFDRRGAALAPRGGGADLSLHRHASALRWLLDRWQGASARPDDDPEGPVYQLQLFVESYAPLTPEEQGQARRLFEQGRSRLLRRCLPERAASGAPEAGDGPPAPGRRGG